MHCVHYNYLSSHYVHTCIRIYVHMYIPTLVRTYVCTYIGYINILYVWFIATRVFYKCFPEQKRKIFYLDDAITWKVRPFLHGFPRNKATSPEFCRNVRSQHSLLQIDHWFDHLLKFSKQGPKLGTPKSSKSLDHKIVLKLMVGEYPHFRKPHKKLWWFFHVFLSQRSEIKTGLVRIERLLHKLRPRLVGVVGHKHHPLLKSQEVVHGGHRSLGVFIASHDGAHCEHDVGLKTSDPTSEIHYIHQVFFLGGRESF